MLQQHEVLDEGLELQVEKLEDAVKPVKSCTAQKYTVLCAYGFPFTKIEEEQILLPQSSAAGKHVV